MSGHNSPHAKGGRWDHPEAVATLERMWLDGVGAQRIAEALGTTRGAVFSKVGRLKLPARCRGGLRAPPVPKPRKDRDPICAGSRADEPQLDAQQRQARDRRRARLAAMFAADERRLAALRAGR